MAITRDNLNDFLRIYTASGGGTVFSGALQNSTAFDLFTDTAVVDDVIYFSLGYGEAFRFKNIRFNIGTALAATSITLAWEYYAKTNGVGAWTALTVTDNTNSFQNLGINTVDFEVPVDIAKISVNGQNRHWVRCRISAVSGLTEGGRTITDKVQCTRNGITVTGGTEATPTTLQDIYNADVAGGWGVFTKQGSGQFRADCNIFIGDSGSNGWLKIVNESLEMGDGYKIMNSWVADGTASTRGLTIGKIDANNRPYQGGFIRGNSFGGGQANDSRTYPLLNLRHTGTGTKVLIYGSVFYNAIGSSWDLMVDAPIFKLRDSIFSGSFGIYCNSSDADLYNIHLHKLGETASSWGDLIDVVTDPGNTWNDIKVDRIRNAAGGGVTASAKNIKALNKVEINRANTLKLIDSEFNTTLLITDANGKIVDQRSFNLKVIDKDGNAISGATVTLNNVNGTQQFSVTTAADGTITEQIVDSVDWTGTAETETNYNPFTLTISKSGFLTYRKDWTFPDRTQKKGIDWTIKLFHSSYEKILGVK